jgi:hypothetical protein
LHEPAGAETSERLDSERKYKKEETNAFLMQGSNIETYLKMVAKYLIRPLHFPPLAKCIRKVRGNLTT